MTNWKRWALSGVVMTLAASGLAQAQSLDLPRAETAPAAAPAATAATPAGDRDDEASMMDDGDEMSADDRDGYDDDAMPGDGETAEAPRAGGEARPAPGDARPPREAGHQAGDGDRRAPREGRMGWMDRNRDGAIEKDEFMARRAERLKAADANGDGVLSKTELEAMVLQQIAERRARKLERRLDIDGDGKVTLAELETMRDKRFAVMDKNDDGRIDGRELRDIHRGVGREMAERRMGHGGPHAMWRGEGRHGRHGGEAWRYERGGERGAD